MSEIGNFIFEDDNVKSYIEKEIFILKIKKNAFEIATDLNESNQLFRILSSVDREEKIKIVFLYNETGSMDEESYESYLQHLLNIQPDNSAAFINDIEKQTIRSRQINILNNFIQIVLNVKKLVVFGLQGCIVTPFFGASLAGDIRFATEDLLFSLAHTKYGIHPTGALPFFLPKYVGMNRAQQILFRDDKIKATEAGDFGLVHQIFPVDNFPERCLTELSKLSEHQMNLIRTTKQLLNIHYKEIQYYFEQESKITLL